MSAVRNPFVDYLTRYTTASPDHEAAFDEFLAQAPPPTGGPLRLNTRVEDFVRACFACPEPPSVILTGNAGDGKTYLCRQIVATFTGHPVDDWEALAEQPLERDGIRLHVIKDLSELGPEGGIDVLRKLAAAHESASADRYLIAANEGRLRDLLGQAQTPRLYQDVEQQLQRGVDAGSRQLVVINLTAVTTSTFVPAALRWMTADEHWAACAPCPIRERCPVRHNALRLSDPHIAGRVQLLYQLLEHLDIHVTVRDMLIHLAYTLTGDRRCYELQGLDARRTDRSGLAYYANIWGGPEGGAFRRKASVVQHLDRLRVGDHSLFEIDDFIVNGAEQSEHAATHRQLFAPAVDLDFRRFGQDRLAYVEGGAEQRAGEEAGALLAWLPHCRRKLFFEWRDEQRVNQLIAFRYLDTYLRLLADERGAHEEVCRHLVLGLNRAFSRLYLTDSDTLYVTSQYLHSAEQSRPLVRLAIPASGITLLRVDPRVEQAFDRAWPDLYLRIGAPPALLLHNPSAAGPQSWRLNLLLFEYLMRLAHGGTYNVLAEECELSVRNLKDRLLSAFASEPDADDDVVEFFVAERRRYSLKRLRIDKQGVILAGG
ncbi:MAG TPA: hypothetical protein VNL77_22485 [Roseiflexaceae bacterium]|nr:hypothetical protein [Roseiflexaceae bacterium]